MDEKRTALQNKILFALLNQLGADEAMRRELAQRVSLGRTVRTSKLTKTEMNNLINILKKQPHNNPYAPGQRQRLKILGLCYDLGWVTSEGKADKELLNHFLSAKGVVKKAFQKMTIQELNQTVSQLESIRKKTFFNQLTQSIAPL